MEIVKVDEVTDELVAAFARLVPQLVGSSLHSDFRSNFEATVRSASATVLVAREESRVVGTLTLVVYRTPSGIHAWIEDVVVDEDFRGRHIGETLCREAVSRARALGADAVDLTSRPSRVAANHLYRKIGFQERETNMYRLPLKEC
jgi:ribosomal protein S18 acetylase RimI-like enzyme